MLICYHTVVVGYDGSIDADRSVEAAADQVGPDGTVHVVTAHHPESRADLVVVGSRGLSRVQRFLRSVSARVASHAPMSVLIVHDASAALPG